MTHNAEKDAPQHGDRSQCLECGGRIHYIEYYQWAGTHYEVLDAWWAHNVHPGDDHDARPIPPAERDCNGYALGSSCECASSADCPASRVLPPGQGICWCDGPDCGQTPCAEEQPR